MSNRFIFNVFLILFFLLFGKISDAAIRKPVLRVRLDSSKVIVKNFDKKALDSLRAEKEFDYGPNDLKSASLTWWSRFWTWVRDIFEDLWKSTFGRLANVPYMNSIVKYGLLTLAVLLLIYSITKAAGLDAMQLLKGESNKTNLPYTESLENIHQINFDLEIEKAAAQCNYRLAVRLLYLKCLKQLSDVNLIKWETDKTNAAYVYELTDPLQKQTFGDLTRQFEYAWYGNFPVDERSYSGICQLFLNFKKQLP